VAVIEMEQWPLLASLHALHLLCCCCKSDVIHVDFAANAASHIPINQMIVACTSQSLCILIIFSLVSSHFWQWWSQIAVL